MKIYRISIMYGKLALKKNNIFGGPVISAPPIADPYCKGCSINERQQIQP